MTAPSMLSAPTPNRSLLPPGTNYRLEFIPRNGHVDRKEREERKDKPAI